MKSVLLTVAALMVAGNAVAQVRDVTDEPLPPENKAQTQYLDGKFPPVRVPPDTPGGHIQKAWNNAPAGAGVLSRAWDPSETIRVQLRSGMNSTVVLPMSEVIADYSLGDQVNFATRPVRDQKNKLWVWAVHPGYDTNLNIITKAGAVYTIYLRGETWNTENITQQIIELKAGEPSGGVKSTDEPPEAPLTGYQQQTITALASNMPPLSSEWVRKGCSFDPSKIRHDRVMKGDGNIGPVSVFHDQCFTYLDWGADPKPWPGVWQVIDRVDQPVNFDRSLDGRFQIVFSTAPLSLVSGERRLCITTEK